MSKLCPTCKQVLPWKRPEAQVSKEDSPELSPEDQAAVAEKKRLADVKFMKDNAKACVCWLCGHHMSIRVYSDHMDKHRKEGFRRRPFKSNRTAAEIKAEWQEADA